MKAKIAEIFNSIQGEGIYLGENQIFIRFYGCNLNQCIFCDTQLDSSRTFPCGEALREYRKVRDSFKEYKPYDLFEHLKLYTGDFRCISLTGGEPLVQKDFLKEFLPLVKQRGYKTYLETNATLPQALEDIIEFIDIIAMDFKFSSSTGMRDFWQEHEMFLKIALQKDVFVKAVICHTTDVEDLKKAVKLISNFNHDITFVLQPNSFEVTKSLMNKIEEYRRYALEFLSNVRVIPQVHKLVGVK
jgi:organic radical activating enzyme